jgi:hypothetical protein
MNAELVLYLMEQDISLDAAKAVAETNPKSVPELAIALIEHVGLNVGAARDIANEAPLRQPLTRNDIPPDNAAPDPSTLGPRKSYDTEAVVHGTYVPVTGADGLTDAQRNALQRGIGLCPNCQQPKDDHLPGCARVAQGGMSPMDPRAVTKPKLPPVL